MKRIIEYDDADDDDDNGDITRQLTKLVNNTKKKSIQY